MKKIIYLIFISLIPAFFLAGCSTTPTGESYATYYVNGTNYISLSNLCSAKGISWDYDSFTRIVTLTKDSHKICFIVGDGFVVADGKQLQLSNPVDLYQGMLVVPYSFKEQAIDEIFKEYYPQHRGTPTALRIKKIVIDAGHGGEDPGALGRSGLKEKDVNLDIAKRLSEILRQDGIEVVMTRSSDRFISLPGRVSIANNSGADLFLSVHSNANRLRSMNGFEVYYVAPSVNDSSRAYNSARTVTLKPQYCELGSQSLNLKAIIWDMIYTSNQAESIHLSRSICRSMDENSDSRIIGIKGAKFAVLRGTRMPAVLVETGFVSNREEERLLKNSYYRQKVAENIAKGITDFAKIYKNVEVAQR